MSYASRLKVYEDILVQFPVLAPAPLARDTCGFHYPHISDPNSGSSSGSCGSHHACDNFADKLKLLGVFAKTQGRSPSAAAKELEEKILGHHLFYIQKDYKEHALRMSDIGRRMMYEELLNQYPVLEPFTNKVERLIAFAKASRQASLK